MSRLMDLGSQPNTRTPIHLIIQFNLERTSHARACQRVRESSAEGLVFVDRLLNEGGRWRPPQVAYHYTWIPIRLTSLCVCVCVCVSEYVTQLSCHCLCLHSRFNTHYSASSAHLHTLMQLISVDKRPITSEPITHWRLQTRSNLQSLVY